MYGKDLESKTNRWEVHHDYQFTKPSEGTDLTLKGSSRVDAPFVPADLALSIDYAKNTLSYDFSASLLKNRVGSKATAKVNQKVEGDYDVEVSANLNKHTAKLDLSREIKGTHSKLEHELTLSTGLKAELDVEFDHEADSQNADVKVDGSVKLSDKEEPYTVNVAVKLTPKKVDSTGKIHAGKFGDIVVFDVKVNRGGEAGAPKDGKYSATVKDLLTAEGSFKSANGKGEGNVLVDFPTVQRKVKLDTVFHIDAPTFDSKTDFYYDFARNPTKKISVESKNQASRQSVDSKTTVDVAGDKYQVDVQTKKDGTLFDGKRNAIFKVTLPDERQLSGEVKTEYKSAKDKPLINAKYSVKLVDQLPTKKSRSVTYSTTLSDYDTSTSFFKSQEQFEYVDFEGKNAVVNGEYRHQPNGHFKTGSAAVTAKGSLLPEPIDILVSLDEYCPVHAIYRVNAAYGNQGKVQFNGNYHVGDATKPYDYDFQATASIPNSPVKSLQVKSSGKVARPTTENGDFEAEFTAAASLNDKSISIDSAAKGNLRHGTSSFKLTAPEVDPISVDASFSSEEPAEDQHSGRGSVEVKYGKGRTIKATADAGLSAKSVKLHANLQTPFENARSVDVAYKRTKSADNTYDIIAHAAADDKRYELTSQISTSDVRPSVKIILSHPGGEPIRVGASFNRLGERKFNGHIELANIGAVNLDAKTEVSAATIESFSSTFDVDAPRLRLNKIHAEVRAKPGSGGKGVEFSATSEGKNIISGSADYTIKQNGGTDIEGRGTVKIYDQQKSANFVLRQNNEKLDGLSFVFNANVGGDEKVNANLVLKSKDLQVAVSICEENNRCYKFEVKSTLKPGTAEEPFVYEHDLFILVDLLELGFDKEFQLKATTYRKTAAFKHDLEVRLKSKDNVQYVYRVLVDNAKASAELVLPKRTLAVDAVYRVPNKDIFGQYEASITTYLDKANHPDKKASLSVSGNLVAKDQKVSSRAEVKFAHPALKELRITGSSEFNRNAGVKAVANLELDIFKQRDQAITLNANFGRNDLAVSKGYNATYSASVRSPGLGLDYAAEGHSAISVAGRQVSSGGSVTGGVSNVRFGYFIFGSTENAQLIITALDENIIELDGSINPSTSSATASASGKLIGNKPFTADIKANNWRSIKANLKGNSNLHWDTEFTLGKVAKVVLNGNGGELICAQIALDRDHFLTSEFRIDSAKLKSAITAARDQLRSDVDVSKKQLRERLDKYGDAVKTQAQKVQAAIPDFQGIRESYEKESKKLVDELLADKSLKQIYDFV